MVEREGYETDEPSGMTVRERERRVVRQRRGEPEPEAVNPSGQGTVSEHLLRQSVVGGTGQGGGLDQDVQETMEEETE
jgi:hypothetical protein